MTLDMQPLMCGSTWLVLISTINLTFLSSSSSSSSRKEMDVVGAVPSEFYGGSGCWTSERWISELEKHVLALKFYIFCHKFAPCLHQPVATLLESAASGSCAKRDTVDKKIKLMVLMSTRLVAPHIVR